MKVGQTDRVGAIDYIIDGLTSLQYTSRDLEMEINHSKKIGSLAAHCIGDEITLGSGKNSML